MNESKQISITIKHKWLLVIVIKLLVLHMEMVMSEVMQWCAVYYIDHTLCNLAYIDIFTLILQYAKSSWISQIFQPDDFYIS